MICADTVGCFLPPLLSICPPLSSHREVTVAVISATSPVGTENVRCGKVLWGTTGGYPPHQPLCPTAGKYCERLTSTLPCWPLGRLFSSICWISELQCLVEEELISSGMVTMNIRANLVSRKKLETVIVKKAWSWRRPNHNYITCL